MKVNNIIKRFGTTSPPCSTRVYPSLQPGKGGESHLDEHGMDLLSSGCRAWVQQFVFFGLGLCWLNTSGGGYLAPHPINPIT